MTHLLKLLDKMYKYEMDPTRTVGATEWTRDVGQMDGRTDGWSETNIPPNNFVVWGYNYVITFTCLRHPFGLFHVFYGESHGTVTLNFLINIFFFTFYHGKHSILHEVTPICTSYQSQYTCKNMQDALLPINSLIMGITWNVTHTKSFWSRFNVTLIITVHS